MRHIKALALMSLSMLAIGCGGKASPEKCTAVAEHMVTVTTKAAAGEAGAKAGSAAELLAVGENAGKISEEARKSPQYQQIYEGCQQLPTSIADCILAAKDLEGVMACQPK